MFNFIPKAYACMPSWNYDPPPGYIFQGFPNCRYIRTVNVFTIHYVFISIATSIIVSFFLFLSFKNKPFFYRLFVTVFGSFMIYGMLWTNFDFILPWENLGVGGVYTGSIRDQIVDTALLVPLIAVQLFFWISFILLIKIVITNKFIKNKNGKGKQKVILPALQRFILASIFWYWMPTVIRIIF